MTFASIYGDSCRILVAINTVVFAVTVFLDHHHPRTKDRLLSGLFLDPLWKEQGGFCVSNVDTPYFTSHDLCFYVDLVLAGILRIVLQLLEEEQGMQQINKLMKYRYIPFIVTIGIIHGIFAASLRWFGTNNADGTNIIPVVNATYIFSVYLPSILCLVWTWQEITNTKTETTTTTNRNSSMSSSNNNNHKGFEYALFPLVVEIPLCAIRWIESIQCSLWVIRVWGHLMYNVYIPLSILLFYMMVWVKVTATNTSNKVKLKVK